MRTNLIILTILGSTLFSCNTSQKDKYASINNLEDLIINSQQEHPGKKLMENNCNVCHNPKTTEDAMIAPPMVAVKMHYIAEDTSKEDFINAMVEWSKKPSKKTSKMPGAVKKFGLMPYQYYPEESIRQIADYMYDYEIEEPKWFEDHYSQMHSDRPKANSNVNKERGNRNGKLKSQIPKTQPSAKERGMQMAQTTKAELGKNLMGQIQKNGVIAALDFCNVQALPITDSMATVHKALIKRVSDKARNPKNRANDTELKYIDTFKNQVVAGGEINPIIVETNSETEFYYPIVTNSMCLKCHGTPEKELELLTLSKIQELYPFDKAIGYKENQVRGIWSIRFKN